MIRLLQLGRRFKWNASIDKAFGLKWTKRKKKIFQVQSKRAGMKTGLLFASKCNLNYTKGKLQSELLYWNQSITEMLGSSSNDNRWITPGWKYTKYESTSLTAQIKESTIVFVLLHASVSNTKRSMMKDTNNFFFPFYMNYKNTIRG